MAEFDLNQYDPNDPYGTAKLAYAGLQSLGVSPVNAAGAIGSLMGESGGRMNTRALNPGDGADGSDSVGFAQWNGSRAAALKNTAAGLNLPVHDPRAQVAHMMTELQTTHAPVLAALRSSPDDLNRASDLWTRRFEVAAPATAHQDRRNQYGADFLRMVSGAPADPQTTGAITPQPGTLPQPPARPAGALPLPNAVPGGVPGAAPAEAVPAVAPAAPAVDEGGFLGMKSMGDLGKRMTGAAAWLAPTHASAYANVINAQTQDRNSDTASKRADAELALKQRATALAAAKANAPDVTVSESASGKQRIVRRTYPDGTVKFEAIDIPTNQQADPDEGKDIPAALQNQIAIRTQNFDRGEETLKQLDEVIKEIREGKIDFSAYSQIGYNNYQNFMNSNDPNAVKVARAYRIAEGLIEERANLEKGGLSNKRVEQVSSQIKPNGSGQYNTAVWEDALRQNRDLFARVIASNADSASRMFAGSKRGSALKSTRSQTDETEAAFWARRGQEIRAENDRLVKEWHDTPYAPRSAAPAAPRVTSPLVEGLNRAFGPPPGAR